jgi:hypothetical protein
MQRRRRHTGERPWVQDEKVTKLDWALNRAAF